MRKRIFISGPITNGDRVQNFAEALKAYRTLAERGFAPLCPQLSMLIAFILPGIDYEGWMEVDQAWLDVADAVLRLPGESPGADREVTEANRRGVPVYHNLGRLIEDMSS